MPVSYSFDKRIVVIKMVGEYSTDELKAGVLEALDDPLCPADAVLMFDLRESLALRDRSSDDVRDMAEFLSSHGRRFAHRLGMVTSGDLAFGLMRMGSVFAELGGLTPAVFKELEEARQWLLAEP